jgi:hypothetical protein
MLQISTGKFFKHEAYETRRRAIYYTNYRNNGPTVFVVWRRKRKIENRSPNVVTPRHE